LDLDTTLHHSRVWFGDAEFDFLKKTNITLDFETQKDSFDLKKHDFNPLNVKSSVVLTQRMCFLFEKWYF
jgi:hypothetical protein